MKVTNSQSTSIVVERTSGVSTVSNLETVYDLVHHLASWCSKYPYPKIRIRISDPKSSEISDIRFFGPTVVELVLARHVAKQFLLELGVGPTVVELDRETSGMEIHALLYRLAAGNEQQQPVPAVFVGGIETLIACHINGTLVPLLKDAGALWL